MATEDHDLDEVSSAWIQDRQGSPLKLEAVSAAGRGGPAGQADLEPADLSPLEEGVFGLDWAEEAMDLARASYGEATTFGAAFKALFQKIFEGRGLILLDPLDPALRRAAAPAFRTALEQTDEIHAALESRGAELEEAGYSQQVKVPEHGTLLFSIRNGRRRPVIRDGEHFLIDGEHMSLAQALALLESTPETFSPNALLRPSVQDVMLPTAAYIGGPAELAYMAQAQVVFDRVAGRMPVILPRASFTLVDPRRARLLGKYGLRIQDCWTNRAALEERIARSLVPPQQEAQFERGRREIEAALERLEGSLRDFDPTLAEVAPQDPLSTRQVTKQNRTRSAAPHRAGSRQCARVAGLDLSPQRSARKADLDPTAVRPIRAVFAGLAGPGDSDGVPRPPSDSVVNGGRTEHWSARRRIL
jgi:bacillithiol biosynthesis cysteine-adding enzyme BshC